jgi:hypothetical protein
MRTLVAVSVIAAFTGVIAVAQSKPSPSPLRGVWRVTEVTTTGPTASTNTSPQPGLYIFTDRHYSIVRIGSDQPRPDLPTDIEKATAAELRAVWGPFVSNAGTYEVSGGNVTMRPIVAKNPAVMSAGASNVSSFKVDGKTLWLTGVRNQSGPVTNPATVKLTRVE